VSNTELGEEGGSKNRKMNNYYNADGRSGGFSNDFKWIKIGSSNQIEIYNPDSDTIYRGSIHFKNNDLETIYITLTDYTSDKPGREILVREMNTITENIIYIENKKIKLSSLINGTKVQIVKMTEYWENDYNTDSIIIEKIISSDPFYIDLSNEVDEFKESFIVWINNNCKKITI
jgi:hypothetical protein